MRSMFCGLVAAGVMALGAAGTTQAAPLLAVQFGSSGAGNQAGYDGRISTVAAGVASGTFGTHTVTLTDITTSNGGSTNGVGITYSGGNSSELADSGSFTYASVYKGNAYSNQDHGKFSFSVTGLAANTTYSMKVFVFDWSQAGNPISYNFQDSASNALGSIAQGPAVNPTNNDQAALTFNLTSDGAGVLNFTETASPSYRVRFNALEVSAVPEPASMSLLGLGALTLLRRRKNAEE